MTDRPSDSRIVDVLTFSRLGGERQGRWSLAAMPRLSDSALPADPQAAVDAEWSLRGEQLPVTGGAPEIWLHLQGRITVPLQCQRCLQAVSEPLHVDRRFRFVRTEAEAARLDEDSDDDVLVLEPRLDLAELLEDEFILALPIVPMHDSCPQPLLTPAQPGLRPGVAAQDANATQAERPNPFAALAALRKKPGDSAT